MPPFLYTLMTEYTSFRNLRVSTTRLPIFDQRLQNPAYGYRGLGYFASLVTSANRPPVYILAIDTRSWNHLPETASWNTQLISRNARLDQHFIIVLSEYDPMEPTPQISLPLTGFGPHIYPQYSSRHSSPSYYPSTAARTSLSPEPFSTLACTNTVPHQFSCQRSSPLSPEPFSAPDSNNSVPHQLSCLGSSPGDLRNQPSPISTHFPPFDLDDPNTYRLFDELPCQF